ncbi:MAG: nuclease A inhibitor family protein [Planctomycetes bacterium]|nr:nuclease A inhibitor family protein [Planctomycetota bacterium]
MTRLAAPLLLLTLAAPALAAPDVAGAWDVIGQDPVGRYRGAATLTQDAQGRVQGTLTLEYVRWSWSARRYVSTGRFGAARLSARLQGGDLVGVRRTDAGLAGSLGLTGALQSSIRYRVNERGGRVTSIRGGHSSGRAWEQLHGHRPAATTRDQDLLRLRAELEAATSGMLWLSESDHPFTWVQLDGAADRVTSLDDFKAALGVEAARPAEERTLSDTLGWRTRHEPDETPEEAAEVERHVRLEALLRARLTDVRVYRVAPPGAGPSTTGDLFGAIDVFIVGRNAHGDLVGLRTVSVET